MAIRKKNKPSFNWAWPRLALIVLIIIILVLGGWALKSHRKTSHFSKTSSGAAVNLNPATPQDKQDTANHKRGLTSQPSSAHPTTSSGRLAVTPVITNASSTEIRAFVQGVIEDGGTCTAVLTKESSTVTRNSTGLSNSSYTTCQPIDLSGALSKGIWTLKVTYSSDKAEGSSVSQSLAVK